MASHRPIDGTDSASATCTPPETDLLAILANIESTVATLALQPQPASGSTAADLETAARELADAKNRYDQMYARYGDIVSRETAVAAKEQKLAAKAREVDTRVSHFERAKGCANCAARQERDRQQRECTKNDILEGLKYIAIGVLAAANCLPLITVLCILIIWPTKITIEYLGDYLD